MSHSALYDPQLVKGYHSEYLNLIKFYMNTKRPSVFVRYFNIDLDNSIYDDQLDATYDLYHVSNIKFNVYDYTPTYYLAPIVNTASNVPDLRGQSMDASSSIVTYTIESPRIHDLVMFYGPVSSGEIFRVTGLRTAVNAVHSTAASANWFELELEYAPIKTTQELKIIKHFVYDLSNEGYAPYDEYQEYLRKIDKCDQILGQLSAYYDPYYDMYLADGFAPVETNEAILFFKKFFAEKFKRIYEKYKLPYGYLDKLLFQQVYVKVEDLPFVYGNYSFKVFNISTNTIENYEWSVTQPEPLTEVDKMLKLTLQFLQEAFSWTLH